MKKLIIWLALLLPYFAFGQGSMVNTPSQTNSTTNVVQVINQTTGLKDSLIVSLGIGVNGYVPVYNSTSKKTIWTNPSTFSPTLQDLTAGYGLTAPGVYNGSIARTFKADTTVLQTVLNFKPLGNTFWASKTAPFTITTPNTVANANGATISSGVFRLNKVSATSPGILTTGADTIAGTKVWNGFQDVRNQLFVTGTTGQVFRSGATSGIAITGAATSGIAVQGAASSGVGVAAVTGDYIALTVDNLSATNFSAQFRNQGGGGTAVFQNTAGANVATVANSGAITALSFAPTNSTFTSTITGQATANRTWKIQNKSGVFADSADVAGKQTALSGTGLVSFSGTTPSYNTTSASIASIISDETGSGAMVFGTTPTLATPVINGLATGTGVASAATASTLAARDASANLSLNNYLPGYTTTATAAGTTTLTVASTQLQYFTGTLAQTVVLPVTSTLALGQSFTIVNLSTGLVTVQSSGANNIGILAANSTMTFTCTLTTGTTAASWGNTNITTAAFAVTGFSANNISTGAAGKGVFIGANQANSFIVFDPLSAFTIYAANSKANALAGILTSAVPALTVSATGVGTFASTIAATGANFSGTVRIGNATTTSAFATFLGIGGTNPAVTFDNTSVSQKFTIGVNGASQLGIYNETLGSYGLTISSAGVVKIGTGTIANGASALSVGYNNSSASGVFLAQESDITQTVATSGTVYGFQGVASTTHTSGTVVTAIGNAGLYLQSGTGGTVTTGAGFKSSAFITDGTTTTYLGYSAEAPVLSGTGAIGTKYSFFGATGSGKAFINDGILSGGAIRFKGYTVATLPSGTQGDTAYVTDALAPSFLVTIVGGGSIVTPVFYNGTNWIAQ